MARLSPDLSLYPISAPTSAYGVLPPVTTGASGTAFGTLEGVTSSAGILAMAAHGVSGVLGQVSTVGAYGRQSASGVLSGLTTSSIVGSVTGVLAFLTPLVGASSATEQTLFASALSTLSPVVGESLGDLSNHAVCAGSLGAPLAGYAEGGLIAPPYSVSDGTLQPLVGISLALYGTGGGSDGVLSTLYGHAANSNSASVSGVLGQALGESYGNFPPPRGILYAPLFTQPYFFIALGNTDLSAEAAGFNAVTPSLTGAAYGGGVSTGALPAPALTASGTVTAVARLAAALPALALTASGTAPSVGRLSTSLPDGYTLAAWSGAILANPSNLPNLGITASGTAPIVGRLARKLPVSFGLTAQAGAALSEPLPSVTLVASGTVHLVARLSEALPRPLAISARAGARLSLALPEVALEASGTSASLGSLIKRLPRGFALTAYSGGAASGTLPSAKLSASGTSASLGRLGTTLPRGFALTAYAGGASVGRLKAPALTASGTSASLGRLAKTLPRGFALSAYAGGAAVLSTKSLVLSASGSAPIVGRLSATLPLLTLQAEPGGYAALRLPVLSISAAGTAWTVGRLSGTLPVLTFLGSGTVTQLASLSVSLPALRTVSSGVLSVLLPKLQGAGYSVLSTSGPVLSTENSEAYSITLLDDGTVAVTRYTQYPFNQIHRWQGKYYGVADDGVYELTGDTFDGTPIVSVIETMETDFDRPEFKRAPALYLSGRIGADFNVAVLSSELETDTYPTYRPTSKPGASTHRCVFGQGIRAHYYAYSMTNINGEDFTIDSFQTDIDTTARRI